MSKIVYTLLFFSFITLSCKRNSASNKLPKKELSAVLDSLKTINDTLLTKVKIIDNERDYSNVKRGTIIIDSFKLINIGFKKLELKGINATCDCTTLNYIRGKEILPNDSLTVTYQIDTKDMDKGYNRRTINVIGNFFPYIKNFSIDMYLLN